MLAEYRIESFGATKEFSRNPGVAEFLSENDYGLRPLAVRVRLSNCKQLTKRVLAEADEIVLPVSEILLGTSRRSHERYRQSSENIQLAISEGKLFCEMPPLLFEEDSAREVNDLRNVKALGVTDFITGNLYGIGLAKKLGVRVHGDYGLNITNSLSLCAYAELGLRSATLSFELSASRVSSISYVAPICVGIIAYGKLPLMRFRNCPDCPPSKNTQDGQKGSRILTDRLNKKWTIAEENGGGCLLNSVPLNIADRLGAFGMELTPPFGELRGSPFGELSTITLHFTDETPEEIENILSHTKKGTLPRGERTSGLYFRTVE
jgi:putative protease